MDSIVVWDWNGTLLNDVALNHEILNGMMERRGLARIDLERYRALFRMPIIELYRDLGFTFEDETFEETAKEYFGEYRRLFPQMPLSDGAVEALIAVRGKGLRQYIVSAMNEPDLVSQVREKGIAEFFDGLAGLDNVHAVSKKRRALDFISGFDPKPDILFIGDMDHDQEVAEAIGARCLLYAKGHQRLRPSGNAIVIDDLRDVTRHI